MASIPTPTSSSVRARAMTPVPAVDDFSDVPPPSLPSTSTPSAKTNPMLLSSASCQGFSISCFNSTLSSTSTPGPFSNATSSTAPHRASYDDVYVQTARCHLHRLVLSLGFRVTRHSAECPAESACYPDSGDTRRAVPVIGGWRGDCNGAGWGSQHSPRVPASRKDGSAAIFAPRRRDRSSPRLWRSRLGGGVFLGTRAIHRPMVTLGVYQPLYIRVYERPLVPAYTKGGHSGNQFY
ncbi:hypothetical protein B0T18DRAFT_61048 [Schizothecium vesticola]|uniref:Uncharacterized protein n=1 Tax=Schizothecium vesticola TaxID=314040 RepID=A0AA40F4W3_9PEZI|nr:hypothetical protein B0T18DRAFT_61048 [Schizothecium vesticola]